MTREVGRNWLTGWGMRERESRMAAGGQRRRSSKESVMRRAEVKRAKRGDVR